MQGLLPAKRGATVMADSGTTRVALIGAGFIADVHLRVLRAVPGVLVVAVCDPVRARAERLARRHGVRAVFDGVDALLAAGVATAAHVLVPPEAHAEVALACLRRGLHVLVEKPLALCEGDADRLLQAARERGVVLAVNHNQTFHPALQRLRRHLERGRLGRLEHAALVHSVPLRQLQSGDVAHFMFRTEGNILFEQGVHLFSVVHDLLGPARQVAADTGPPRTLPTGVRFFDTWDVRLACERGTATVRMAFGRPLAEATVHVIGSDGAAFADLQRNACWLRGRTRWLEFLDHGLVLLRGGFHLLGRAAAAVGGYALALVGLGFPADPFLRGMRDSLRDFHRAVRERGAPRNGVPAARAVLDTCLRTAAAAGAELRAPAPRVLPAPGPARPGEVVVLGGTGAIGRECVRLLRAAGRPLSLVVRRPQLLPEDLLGGEMRLFAGDAADPDVLARAFAGAETVLHLATVAGDDPDGVEAAMSAAVRAAGEAARRASVRRLVYASSTAALWLGGRAPVRGAAPTDPRPCRRAAYARGKIAAERELAAQRAAGLDVVIVRPAIVLAPGGSLEHSGIGLWVNGNHCVGWGRGDAPLPLLLAADCAQGLVAALHAEAAANGTYVLAGTVRPTARELIAELRARTGRAYRFHPAPVLWLWLQEVGKHLVKVLARRPRAWPSLRDLRSRSFRAPLQCDDAARDLGFRPEADRERFLQRLLAPGAVPPP